MHRVENIPTGEVFMKKYSREVEQAVLSMAVSGTPNDKIAKSISKRYKGSNFTVGDVLVILKRNGFKPNSKPPVQSTFALPGFEGTKIEAFMKKYMSSYEYQKKFRKMLILIAILVVAVLVGVGFLTKWWIAMTALLVILAAVLGFLIFLQTKSEKAKKAQKAAKPSKPKH